MAEADGCSCDCWVSLGTGGCLCDIKYVEYLLITSQRDTWAQFLGLLVVTSSNCRGHLTPMGEEAKWDQAKENSSHIRQARQRTLLLL